ncbi:MAG: hypothetical protein IT454_18200 [Planctomycetes bacterium]|nr:hypothetical protein [Planctomycetota bacterium]
MNRTTALIVALAILLGHALAIHKTGSNEIAPPFDTAYVAFRVARNFVHTGVFAWEQGVSGLDSYPSLLWIAVAAIPERLYLPVNQFCQAVGMLSAFASVLVLSSFSPKRLSGVIAPLLFVVCGGVASAALSGTETALLGLGVAYAFLSYERERPKSMALGLVIATLARPQGLVFSLALLAIEIVRRIASGGSAPRRSMWLAFATPLAAAMCVALVRFASTGEMFSPWMAQLVNFGPRVRREGLEYLLDYLIASGNATLFVFPLYYLLRGVLSGLGIRACILTLAWAAVVAQGGGGALPFFEAMTPITAVMLVAVQEAMQLALDSKRRVWPQVTWALFLLGLGLSAAASKFPGDLGPLRLEAGHRAWMEPRTLARFGYEEKNGRMGLSEEILATERLREIGLFLRSNIDPGFSVLSPWPGAIGYLSRLRVVDPLGRTTPSPGETRTRPWEGLPRADVAKALAERPEYIVPTIRFGETPPSAQDIAAEWAKSLDNEPHRPQRSLGIRSQLVDYELIAVPVTNPYARVGVFPHGHFYLMRRRDLQLAPRLNVELDGRQIHVDVTHRSHEQLAELRVEVRDRQGSLWFLRPTGEFVRAPEVSARTHLLLYPTGERHITLIRAHLPDELDAVEVRAQLRNPGAVGDSLFSDISEPVSVIVSR